MKMNKVLKGLLIVVLVIGMTGCQEAKQVENIEVQDTKPVVEEKVDKCALKGCEGTAEIYFLNKRYCKPCVQFTKVATDRANIGLYYERLKREGLDRGFTTLLVYGRDEALEGLEGIDWLECFTYDDMAFYLCHLIKEDTGVIINTPFQTSDCYVCNNTLARCICFPTIKDATNVPVYDKCRNCGQLADLESMKCTKGLNTCDWCFDPNIDYNTYYTCECGDTHENPEDCPVLDKAMSVKNCEACGTINIEYMSMWDYLCHDCGHSGSVN